MIILGTNSIKDTGYNVDNSLRFNSGSSDYLNRTPSSAGTQTKATISVWLKRSNLTSNQCFFSTGNNNVVFKFVSNDKLTVYDFNGSSMDLEFTTTQVFRDVSAWYHIVVSLDSTQSTNSDRAKIYVNGSLISNFDSTTYPSQNYNFKVNGTVEHFIGRLSGLSQYFNGYMAEFVNIDGQALAPTSFGEFDEDSGIWKPINVSGLTFGTNGFYLDFENSGALGNDAAGSNNFTVNNLTAIDQSTDTCTNNFATWNPLRTQAGFAKTMADGNLSFTNSSGDNASIPSTMAASSGKWYAEFKCTTSASNWGFGIAQVNQTVLSGGSHGGYPDTQGGVAYLKDGRLVWYAGGDASSDTGTTYGTNDIIGILMDLDNTRVYWYKNDTLVNSGGFDYSVVNSGSTLENNYYFMAGSSDGGTDPVLLANFGSPPHAITSGNTDGNGYGNFEFATKGGYALNTKNLAEYG
jgi:hypothetical protein